MGDINITDFNLTGRERDILTILWNAEKGLIASEIVKCGDEDLTINTVQAVLKKLLKRNLIQVDQIVYSGTVLSRSYKPTLSEAEFQTQMISSSIIALERFSISPASFMLGFWGRNKEKMTKEEADALMEMIQKYSEG